jgi:hypothetical protein
MIASFAPSFQHFQKDIERFLKSAGKSEKNEHGQTVFRGYQAAVDLMFRAYTEKEAFAPLVAEFTNYNKTKKAQKAFPEKVSEELVEKTRQPDL